MAVVNAKEQQQQQQQQPLKKLLQRPAAIWQAMIMPSNSSVMSSSSRRQTTTTSTLLAQKSSTQESGCNAEGDAISTVSTLTGNNNSERDMLVAGEEYEQQQQQQQLLLLQALTRGEGSSSSSSLSDHGSLVVCTREEHSGVLCYDPAATSLPQSMDIWLRSTGHLLQSREMEEFVLCSGNLIRSAGCAALYTVCLPVTVPFRVASATTGLVVTVSTQTLGTILQHIPHPLRSDPKGSTQEQSSNHQNPVISLIYGIFGIPIVILGVVGKIKDEVGSVVVHMVAPVLGIVPPDDDNRTDEIDQTAAVVLEGEQVVVTDKCDKIDIQACGSSFIREGNDYLDRLRLDFSPDPTASAARPSSSSSTHMLLGHARDRNYSKYLLRVDDLDVVAQDDKDDGQQLQQQQVTGGSIFYIDLNPDDCDRGLLTQALDGLVTVGLSLLSNHPTVRLATKQHQQQPSPPAHEVVPLSGLEIEWKTESSTPKLLRTLVQQSTLERLRTLQAETLIWSGRFKQPQMNNRHQYTVFLARGVIPLSPRGLLDLLWDNSRTSEYNNFCLGRTNLISIQDEVLSGGTEGIKVVRSEMRVPFTSFSVTVSCLMHVRPLPAPEEEGDAAGGGGFVIVSRTLNAGLSGTHVGSDAHVDKNSRKSEILWGINILRRVPNHPHLTDLTSLSQAGSSLVPTFLAQRIGIMGIEDFFRNVRKLPKHQ